MREIPLTQGKVALVDDEDYDRVIQHKWCAQKIENCWYATTNIRVNDIKKPLRMHRLLLGLSFGDKHQVDHLNHNGLDNRRSNLRICTNAENRRNRRPSKKISKYLGVSWRKSNHKWASQITTNNRTINLGSFVREECAALAYDFAALKYHREFANFNF